jgi:ATP-binding cassette subfamily F protein 3
MSSIDGDGVVNYGHNVVITYFAQDQAEKLDPNLTIYETVDAIAEGEVRKDLRSILGTYLYTGEDNDKKVGIHSGGERTRLALCQLLLSPCNFLILDEPTNHLDIQSKEVLKRALIDYEGTFIVVSHDREFLDGLTNRIWDIQDKTLKIHHYDVKEYLAMKMASPDADAKNSLKPTVKEVVKVEEKVVKEAVSFEEQKELKRRRTQFQNQIKKSEEMIAALETKIAKMDEVLLTLDYTNEANSAKMLADYADAKKQLDETMLVWEQGVEDLDNLK